jgi:hypothetical protein
MTLTLFPIDKAALMQDQMHCKRYLSSGISPSPHPLFSARSVPDWLRGGITPGLLAAISVDVRAFRTKPKEREKKGS